MPCFTHIRISAARARRVPGLVALAAVLVFATVTTAAGAGASAKSSLTFPGPVALTTDGAHVWVLNGVDHTVTELDAASGDTVRVIGGSQYHFLQPATIVVGGGHVFVTNSETPKQRYSGVGAVTEIDAATGTLVRILQGAPYNFLTPYSAFSNGVRIWISNHMEGTVDVLGARSGKLITVVGGHKGPSLDEPSGIGVDASHVWITGIVEDARGEPAVLNELTKYQSKPVRRVPGSAETFDYATRVVSDGQHVWLAGGPARGDWNLTELSAVSGKMIGHAVAPFRNASNVGMVLNHGHLWVLYASDTASALQKLNPSTGTVLRTISGATYGFDQPDSLTSDARALWVSNYASNEIIEIDAKSGKLIRTVTDR